VPLLSLFETFVLPIINVIRVSKYSLARDDMWNLLNKSLLGFCQSSYPRILSYIIVVIYSSCRLTCY